LSLASSRLCTTIRIVSVERQPVFCTTSAPRPRQPSLTSSRLSRPKTPVFVRSRPMP
jgi:hypothetical protein